MKKGFLVMMALALVFTLSLGFSDSADARRGGGGFKSSKGSFTQTPKKQDNVQQSSGTKQNGAASTAGTKQGGMFSGGGFMKGMLLGGLAGMMFGGLFGNMGAMGEMLTAILNIAIIVGIILVIRAAFIYIRNNKKPKPDQRRPY